jgi:hypothetical protein
MQIGVFISGGEFICKHLLLIIALILNFSLGISLFISPMCTIYPNFRDFFLAFKGYPW